MCEFDNVAKLRKYAMDNYENGLDFYVECYNDGDFLEILSETGNVVEAKKAMREFADLRAEMASNCY